MCRLPKPKVQHLNLSYIGFEADKDFVGDKSQTDSVIDELNQKHAVIMLGGVIMRLLC